MRLLSAEERKRVVNDNDKELLATARDFRDEAEALDDEHRRAIFTSRETNADRNQKALLQAYADGEEGKGTAVAGAWVDGYYEGYEADIDTTDAFKRGRAEALRECLALIKRLNSSGVYPSCPEGLDSEDAYMAGEEVGFERGKEGCVELLQELLDKEAK